MNWPLPNPADVLQHPTPPLPLWLVESIVPIGQPIVCIRWGAYRGSIFVCSLVDYRWKRRQTGRWSLMLFGFPSLLLSWTEWGHHRAYWWPRVLRPHALPLKCTHRFSRRSLCPVDATLCERPSRSEQVTPIVGNRSEDLANPAHARGGRPSRDQLPFEALLPETVFAMLPPDLEAHLTVVYNALTEASASVRQRGQTLLYLQSLAPVPRVANLLINSTFLVLLLR